MNRDIKGMAFGYLLLSNLILFLFVLTVTGCAHVPKESVQLSEELTGMINSAQASHLALLDQYMAERRQKVDQFMNEKWIPKFMGEFVSKSNIVKLVEDEKDAAGKGKIMHEFMEEGSKEIFKRRTSLTNSLDEIDRILRKALQEHYAEMLVINQSMTAHLRSAAKITSTRDELLQKLRINPKVILPMDKINSSVEKIMKYQGKLDELSNIVKEVENAVKGGK